MNPTELALSYLAMTKRASLLNDAVGHFSNATFLPPVSGGTPVDRTMDKITKVTGTADMMSAAMAKIPTLAKAVNTVAPAASATIQKLVPYAAPAWAASMAAQAGHVLGDPGGTTRAFNREMQSTPLLGRMFAGAGNPPLAIANAGRHLYDYSVRPIVESFRPSPLHGSPTSTLMRSFQAPQ